MTKEITTSELNQYRHEENVKIIDVRPVNAYNGWQLEVIIYLTQIMVK